MSQSKFKNHFTLEEAIGRVAIATVAHPFDLVKILIQLGYEPMPSYPTQTFLTRTSKLAYPGVFSYLSYIRRQDGFMGMFRGLGYKIAYTLVTGYVHVNISEVTKKLEEDTKKKNDDDSGSGDSDDDDDGVYFSVKRVKELMDKLMRETVNKFISMTVAYPIQVLCIRSCAQFIGRETIYSNVSTACKDIMQTGGIGGFYVGFVPRLTGEVCILWASHSLIFCVKGFFTKEATVQGYVAACINFLIASSMYPFNVVSTVMAVNGPTAASLEAAHLNPEFLDWGDCWAHLSRLGQLKRGSSLIWRYVPTRIEADIRYAKWN
jgi:carrier protein